jgi:hypothetical protein
LKLPLIAAYLPTYTSVTYGDSEFTQFQADRSTQQAAHEAFSKPAREESAQRITSLYGGG